MKWVVVKERESQRWFVAHTTVWRMQEYFPKPWSKKTKKRQIQVDWVIPRPENISPFIECHKIIEANTKEEAQCLISSWT